MPLSYDPTSARERSELLALDELHSDPPEWLAWNEWATENYPLEDPMPDPRTPAYLIREAYGYTLTDDRHGHVGRSAVTAATFAPRGPFAREMRAEIAAARAEQRRNATERRDSYGLDIIDAQYQRDRSGPTDSRATGYSRSDALAHSRVVYRLSAYAGLANRLGFPSYRAMAARIARA